MARRVTIVLDDEVYEALAKKALLRYGSKDAISKVINEELKASFTTLSRKKELLKQILSEKKLFEIDIEEFYKFRRELSERFEGR